MGSPEKGAADGRATGVEEGWTSDGAGQQCCPAPSGAVGRQETFSAVSSTTKLVCSDESSVIVKRMLTVLPR